MNSTGSTIETDRTKTVPVEGTVPFLVSYTDPFGYWYIRRQHGQIPSELSGAYTSFDMAKRAIDRYVLALPVKTEPDKKAK